MFKLRSSYLLAVGIFFFVHNLHAQLTITSGANLVTSNGTYIILDNTGLLNSGTINAAGTSSIVFTGTASAANTPLSSVGTISNITLNKAAGGVLLGRNLSVSNTVQLTSGLINLNAYELTLGTTGNLSGESASSYITGTTGGAVVRTATLNSPAAINPGNLGLTITSSSNFGTTTIRRSHLQQTLSGIGNSIYRYYDILPANSSALNAPITLRLNYLDAELSGLSESALGLYTSADNGSNWVRLGANTRDASLNYVERSSAAILSRVTLGDINAILPVRLVSFTAKPATQGVDLQWVTASEHNSFNFDVERSEDGIHFYRFASVPAQGSSSLPQTYTLTDSKAFTGVQFYRLKQIDKDGTATYSSIAAISRGGFVNKVLSVFPSPARSVLYINFTSSTGAKTNLQVMNSNGQQVMSREIQVATGLNTASLNINSLPAGTYLLRCMGISTQPIRFTKIN